jgi:outer membrane lipoprotein-sorting protein
MRVQPLLALLLLAPAQLAEDEAERACRDMEKRLVAAKTLQFVFAITVEVDKTKDELKGNMKLGEGNKARIEVKGTMSGGKAIDMLMVSDGTQMVAKLSGAPTQGPRDTPKSMGDLIRGTVARAGVFAGLFYQVQDRKEPALDDLFQLSDFKIGNREKRGSREVLAIEHKITFRGANEKGMITVWIDGKTLAPEKRIFTINDRMHAVRVMEAYEGLATDAKMDDALFELPKD